VIALIPFLLLFLCGCGTLEEENIDDAGNVSSSETIQYQNGKAKVIQKQVDPMSPYGEDEQGIREAEDMGLMGVPAE
jgi:hypothetical protein